MLSLIKTLIFNLIENYVKYFSATACVHDCNSTVHLFLSFLENQKDQTILWHGNHTTGYYGYEWMIMPVIPIITKMKNTSLDSKLPLVTLFTLFSWNYFLRYLIY